MSQTRGRGCTADTETKWPMTTLTQLPEAEPAPLQVPSKKTWVVERLRCGWPELAILAGTLVILVWGLSKNGYGNQYYAAAERSMTYSWRNFVFGAADPGGWITTDKPPLALWFGALSARVFGFSSWSILLPSAVCGVAAVGLLMAAVRRAWGRWAGRVAGIALALTPTFVAVARVNNPDITLVLFMVAAAYATQRAISDRRPVWMIAAGLCCGLAFLAKLLVVGFVMPGMFAAYLIAGPGGWWRRVRDALLAGGVFLLVIGAWIALIDLTPALSRPYVALSTNNTAQNLVLGGARLWGPHWWKYGHRRIHERHRHQCVHGPSSRARGNTRPRAALQRQHRRPGHVVGGSGGAGAHGWRGFGYPRTAGATRGGLGRAVGRLRGGELFCPCLHPRHFSRLLRLGSRTGDRWRWSESEWPWLAGVGSGVRSSPLPLWLEPLSSKSSS